MQVWPGPAGRCPTAMQNGPPRRSIRAVSATAVEAIDVHQRHARNHQVDAGVGERQSSGGEGDGTGGPVAAARASVADRSTPITCVAIDGNGAAF
jgi:hypothetical protein